MVDQVKQQTGEKQARYNHRDWYWKRRFLKFLLRTIAFPWLAKVDKVNGLENIPENGPGIMMINHIAFIDPFVVLHLASRYIVPLAKVEVYDYPLVGVFPRIWGVIPVHREEVDRDVIRKAVDVLRAGELILVAPEGTRNHELQQGKDGAAYLASRTGAPIIPVAIQGTRGFPTFPLSKRWWQGGAVVTFGKPFRYREDLKRARGDQLRLMTDEAMQVLASLLPEEQQGYYKEFSTEPHTTILDIA